MKGLVVQESDQLWSPQKNPTPARGAVNHFSFLHLLQCWAALNLFYIVRTCVVDTHQPPKQPSREDWGQAAWRPQGKKEEPHRQHPPMRFSYKSQSITAAMTSFYLSHKTEEDNFIERRGVSAVLPKDGACEKQGARSAIVEDLQSKIPRCHQSI